MDAEFIFSVNQHEPKKSKINFNQTDNLIQFKSFIKYLAINFGNKGKSNYHCIILPQNKIYDDAFKKYANSMRFLKTMSRVPFQKVVAMNL